MGKGWLDDMPEVDLGTPRRHPTEVGKKCPVVYLPPPVQVHCPQCYGLNVRVTKTLGTNPVERYQFCRDCGCNFKTIQPLT